MDGSEFKRLEKYWYEKLRKEGFEDIEDSSHEDRLLKEWSSNFFRNNFNRTTYEATLKYYEDARALLHTYEFKNPAQRKIWAMHCEGKTEREIAGVVKKYKKSMVHHIIAKISKLIKKE